MASSNGWFLTSAIKRVFEKLQHATRDTPNTDPAERRCDESRCSKAWKAGCCCRPTL